MRLDSVFKLSEEANEVNVGVTKILEEGEKNKKMRLRTNKRYKISVKALASQVGVYRVPLLVAFYHDTASPRVEGRGDEVRSIMSHLAVELLLKVQTGEMSSLAPSKPFSQPSKLQRALVLIRLSVNI